MSIGKSTGFLLLELPVFDIAGVAYCEQFRALAKAPTGTRSGSLRVLDGADF